MYGDQLGVVVVVTRCEGLLQARYADGDRGFHASFIVPVHLRATTPGHEFRVARNVGHQIKHLLIAVWDED